VVQLVDRAMVAAEMAVEEDAAVVAEDAVARR
jgi:hypothetical protein